MRSKNKRLSALHRSNHAIIEAKIPPWSDRNRYASAVSIGSGFVAQGFVVVEYCEVAVMRSG